MQDLIDKCKTMQETLSLLIEPTNNKYIKYL
jgi:hypothetical protein